MTNMADFFTREKANNGIKLPLVLPTGEPTEHWLIVRSSDSDEFKKAEALANRKLLQLAKEPTQQELVDLSLENRLDMLSVLVSGWSFDNPCTPENVRNFLQSAPQIADAVDKTAGNRRFFYSLASSGFTDTPSQSAS